MELAQITKTSKNEGMTEREFKIFLGDEIVSVSLSFLRRGEGKYYERRLGNFGIGDFG